MQRPVFPVTRDLFAFVLVGAVGVFCALWALSAMADPRRASDVYLPATVAVNRICVAPLSDGGVVAHISGTAEKSGGGTVDLGTKSVELSGAARTTALNFLSGGAVAALKADEGL